MKMMTATDYAAVKAARQFAAAALATANPHLITVSDKVDSLNAAAKNIRIELKAAFPAVKFSVKSSRFSGGDSIRINWIDGPTTEQVDAIVGRYEAGSFDGMTDCYNYRGDRAFTDAFGDAKFVQTSRDYSDRLLNAVIGRVCRWLGGLDVIPTAADYKAGKLWNLRTSGGCDVSQQVSRALSRHTCSVGK